MAIVIDVPIEGVICTATGRYVRPLDLQPEDVAIEDVAHALSNLCRFSGHTRRFYSVAQHSVLVSRLLDGTGHERWGLLHDASEAYLIDLPRPLKHDSMLGPPYLAAEARARLTIAARFDLPLPLPDDVRDADSAMLAAERRDLMPQGPRWAMLRGVTPPDERVIGWEPWKAEAAFLARYEMLWGRV